MVAHQFLRLVQYELFLVGLVGMIVTLALGTQYPLGPRWSFGDGVMAGVFYTCFVLAFVTAPVIWVLSHLAWVKE